MPVNMTIDVSATIKGITMNKFRRLIGFPVLYLARYILDFSMEIEMGTTMNDGRKVK